MFGDRLMELSIAFLELLQYYHIKLSLYFGN